MDDNKRTPGGRDNSRRNNNNRPRREGNAPAQGAGRGSNAQPKFDPHFVSAPEATPLRSAKKNAATPAVPAQTIPTAMQNRQPAQRVNPRNRCLVIVFPAPKPLPVIGKKAVDMRKLHRNGVEFNAKRHICHAAAIPAGA